MQEISLLHKNPQRQSHGDNKIKTKTYSCHMSVVVMRADRNCPRNK